MVGNLRGDAGESLKINLETGVWSDFATGESGGCLIGLYAAKERVPYREAAHRLRRRFAAASRTRRPVAKWPVPKDAPPLPFVIGQRSPIGRGGFITGIWAYRDHSNELLGYTMRVDRVNEAGDVSKDILPVHFFDSEGLLGWKVKGHGHGHGHDLDPIYGLDRLERFPSAPVLIVEGERTADAAAVLFPSYVAISWMGGAKRAGRVDWEPLRGREVTYWPDADEAGQRSVDVLMGALPPVARLAVVQLPLTLPRGWDLADPAPDGLDVAQLLSSAVVVEQNLLRRLEVLDIEALTERLVFNSVTLQFFDPVTSLRLDRIQLNSHFRHSMGPQFADRLLASPSLRKALGFTYRPGVQDVIVHDEHGQAFINIWRGGGVTPIEGDATLFHRHLRYLCSSDEEFEYLCDWLAFLVQQPGVKIMCAVVLVGRQGTGKTALIQLLTTILGRRNVTIISTTEIKSDFNEWLEGRQLIVVEEIMALGRREIMNALKPLITQERIAVNAKHQRRYEIENAANFMFLSNSHDALALENGDRRYFVVHNDAEPKDAAYYNALFSWMNQNAGVALDWLMKRNLSKFDPNKPPPMTHGKAAMIEASSPPLDAILDELIDNHSWPFEGDLIDLLPTVGALNGPGSPAAGVSVNLSSLRNALRRRGAVMFGQQKGRVDGRDLRASLWSIRNHELYARMTPSERIASFFSSRRPG